MTEIVDGNNIKPDINRTRTTTTTAYDYPYYWSVHIGSQAHTIDQVILDPKSKEDKVKVTNLRVCQNFKFFNFEKNYSRDTPSEVTW